MTHYHEFRVAGEQWTSDDYTLNEMITIEQATQFKWWSLDLAGEAGIQRAAIEAWYRRTMSDDDAAKKAGELTARDIRVTRVEGDDLPDNYNNGIPQVDPGKPQAADD